MNETTSTRRDVDLLGHIEAVILSLDEEARMDLHDEFDRLVDMCKARDPLAVAAAWPRNPNVVLTIRSCCGCERAPVAEVEA